MANEQSFMRILRDQVVAQANLLDTLTAHPTLVGAGRERAVMDMLRGQLPRRYEVLSGTILGQDDEGSWQKENRQLDVMVVDTFDYPTLLRNGDIAVVLPQAVRVVIEVKSDLERPADPDKAAKAAEEGSVVASDRTTKDASSGKNESKPRETFLDALKQVSRNRSLFGEMAPVLTILLSHKYPAGNQTLRQWLEVVVKARGKLHDTIRHLEKGSEERASAEQEASLLEASLLPNVIIADRGALAVRAGSQYEFFIAGHDKKTAPGLVTLVSYVVEHLDRQDPVLGLTRFDEKYSSWRDLRLRGSQLFQAVMVPQVVPDANNPTLDLTKPLTTPDEDDPRSQLVEPPMAPDEDDSAPGPASASKKGDR